MSNQIKSGHLRIYRIPVEPHLLPKKAPFRYPSYSKDWGVEQDFSNFLAGSDFVTEDKDSATHHYLPIFWTRYWVKNNYGKVGVAELNSYLDSLGLDESKLFTICQYDDGPLIDLNFGKGLFLSSRKTEGLGQDIPLIASDLPKIWTRKKKYLMSFAGRFDTHPIRMELREAASKHISVHIAEQQLNSRRFAALLQASLVVLCPRGYGGSSFRFYEAMQSGSVPCLIGDIDTRAFKSQIPWDKISFYFKTPGEAMSAIEKMNFNSLQEMGLLAKDYYNKFLKLGTWNNLLINEMLADY